MKTNRYISTASWVFMVACVVLQNGAGLPAEHVSSGASQQFGEAARRVMTFYYPWYGVPEGPGGAGRTVHWGRIDKSSKDIEASTHYPAVGPYDSHDPNIIDRHCRWAKQAGIDTFIVSWWGHGDYTDRAMSKILDGCAREGLSACIYYETTPNPQTPETAAKDIVKVVNKYGRHNAYLKVEGKPVVFVYGRALQELGLAGWVKAVEIINADYKPGVTTIGDQFSYGAARVFDGLHTYNTAGSLQGLKPPDVQKWAAGTYQSWVQLAEQAGKISAITVIPGYDDTKIRKPGLAVERFDGELYRIQWQEAIKADPHWVLVTSFNEWHEGSEIEPSEEYGQKYIELTGEYAKRFKAGKRAAHSKTISQQVSAEEKIRLVEKLKAWRIGVLPGAESMAFWWLMDIGVKPEILSWEQLVQGNLASRQYPLLMYCSGELYRTTVTNRGDVDEALVGYLKSGGFIAFLPSLPWPLYYDENGRPANRSDKFGLALHGGWENPVRGEVLNFVQAEHLLPHVPGKFAFPSSGDLRWRPFVVRDQAGHISLLQLQNGDGKYLGDAVAYAEPKGGGKIIYAWFSLFNGPYADAVLYDLFDFISASIQRRQD